MKFTFLLIFSFIITLGSAAFAGQYSCPETHPEYNKVLKELQDFKKILKEKSECRGLATDFDDLTDLISSEKRGEILSLVFNNQGKSLSAESAKKIQKYAGSITRESGKLIAVVSEIATEGFFSWGSSDKCSLDEQDQLDGIEKLTKIAYDATNLISKVAGPYGVPLQIGAEVVYGVVQGLQVYAKNSSRIDFDPFEKRQFFESAVCIMSKFDRDVQNLNNPRAHLRNLEQARREAARVVNVVRDECADCIAVLDASSTKAAKLAFNNLSSAVGPRLGEKAYQGKANLEWIDDEIKKFRAVVNYKSGGIGPRELQSLMVRINKFILKTMAPDFLKWYASKASTSNDELKRTISLMTVRMRNEVIGEKKKFDQSLPESLKGEIDGTHPGYQNMVKTSYILSAPEISNLYFVNKNQNLVLRHSSSYYSLLGEAYDIWKLSDFNIRVVQEYCQFFEDSNKYHNVEKACEANKFVWFGLRTGYQSFYLANLINNEETMREFGPYDFRLEEHYKFIYRFKDVKKGALRIAEEGLNFEAVLAGDRGIRQKDGRLKTSYMEAFEEEDWWNSTDEEADEFLNSFDNLK